MPVLLSGTVVLNPRVGPDLEGEFKEPYKISIV